jgi:hypothetical protein
MIRKQMTTIAICGLLVLAAGCQRIQEPWVRGPDRLEQERARPAPVQAELRHRFLAVQTDR